MPRNKNYKGPKFKRNSTRDDLAQMTAGMGKKQTLDWYKSQSQKNQQSIKDKLISLALDKLLTQGGNSRNDLFKLVASQNWSDYSKIKNKTDMSANVTVYDLIKIIKNDKDSNDRLYNNIMERTARRKVKTPYSNKRVQNKSSYK